MNPRMRAPKQKSSIPVTDVEPLVPSELVREVACARLAAAVANCERMKREMDLAVGHNSDGNGSSKFEVRRGERERSVYDGSAIVGRRHKGKAHPELDGISRSEYTTRLIRKRRAMFYARGLTSRGTPRVVPAAVAFNKPWSLRTATMGNGRANGN